VYVAGYDRRLRHPAWVCSIPLLLPLTDILLFLPDGRTSDTRFSREIAHYGEW
jgi:hypothetical protein